jgi:hypothetical protein
VLFRLCSVMAIDPTEAVAKHLDTLEKRLERLGK